MLVKDGKRDELKAFLAEHNIPSMIYYPVPLNEQEAFKGHGRVVGDLNVSVKLCQSVLSLPIHTEMKDDVQEIIIEVVKKFYT